jgi:hypothetical protein
MDQAQPNREAILADIAELGAEAERTRVAATNAKAEFERKPSPKAHTESAVATQIAANAHLAHKHALEIHADLLEQVAREKTHNEATEKLAALEPTLAQYTAMVDGLRASVGAFAEDYSRRVDALVAYLWMHRKDSEEAVGLASFLGRSAHAYKLPTFENLLVAMNARWAEENRHTSRHSALGFANAGQPHVISASIAMPIRKV